MLGLINLLMNLLHIYSFIIIAAALITWVQPNPYNPIVQFLRRVTEPVLRPVRGLVPPEKLGGLDISPLIVLVVIEYVIPRVLLALLL
ncbi:MAG TPA: YggT family protein [Methylomirabilota bacterium]|jgi:YggT family protein|nr:YggT family protein [Methylomirabilota bacterium]